MAIIRQTLDDVKCSPDTIYSPSRASAATSVPLATPSGWCCGVCGWRLRPYFLYNRAQLGDLSRAARTITAFIRATAGEPDLSLGLVASIQTHGSLANWQPHYRTKAFEEMHLSVLEATEVTVPGPSDRGRLLTSQHRDTIMMS